MAVYNSADLVVKDVGVVRFPAGQALDLEEAIEFPNCAMFSVRWIYSLLTVFRKLLITCRAAKYDLEV